MITRSNSSSGAGKIVLERDGKRMEVCTELQASVFERAGYIRVDAKKAEVKELKKATEEPIVTASKPVEVKVEIPEAEPARAKVEVPDESPVEAKAEEPEAETKPKRRRRRKAEA